MKKISQLILATTVGVGLLSSCHSIEGTSGALTTEYRTASSDFNQIEVEGSIDVYVTQDTSYDILVEAGENIIGHVETSIVNKKLVIYESHHDYLNNRSTKVYVSCDSLASVLITGSGDFDATGILSDILTVNVEGSGDLNLDVTANYLSYELEGSGDCYIVGSTDDLNIQLEGSGDIEAKNLNANTVNVTLEGSGDIKVTALQAIDASIEGSGDIYYYGNPAVVNTQVSGSGDIIGH